MKFQNIVDSAHRNRDCSISAKNGKYIIQIYSDGAQGNIKRSDGTVICRFVISDNTMKIAPAKKETPYEFGYECYPFLLTDKISKISEIPNINVKDLYEILDEFAEK